MRFSFASSTGCKILIFIEELTFSLHSCTNTHADKAHMASIMIKTVTYNFYIKKKANKYELQKLFFFFA